MTKSMVSTRKFCIFVHDAVNVIRRKMHGSALNRTRHKLREENVALGDNFPSSFIVFLSSIGSSA